VAATSFSYIGVTAPTEPKLGVCRGGAIIIKTTIAFTA
jgi:hypothetical protein